MICWIFAGITVLAALVAAFIGDLRRATLSLWVAGLGVGGIYLTLGAEVLAVIQWIISTLVAISFVFFAVMFGEYGPPSPTGSPSPAGAKDFRNLLKSGLALLLGSGFAAVIWFGTSQLPELVLALPEQGNDMAAMSQTLAEGHLLSLEVLALTLFLVLIGGGVIARPDAEVSS